MRRGRGARSSCPATATSTRPIRSSEKSADELRHHRRSSESEAALTEAGLARILPGSARFIGEEGIRRPTPSLLDGITNGADVDRRSDRRHRQLSPRAKTPFAIMVALAVDDGVSRSGLDPTSRSPDRMCHARAAVSGAFVNSQLTYRRRRRPARPYADRGASAPATYRRRVQRGRWSIAPIDRLALRRDPALRGRAICRASIARRPTTSGALLAHACRGTMPPAR